MGGPEILVIVIVLVLLFGAKRIPDIARGLGQGVRSFRGFKNDIMEVKKDVTDQVNKEVNEVKSDVNEATGELNTFEDDFKHMVETRDNLKKAGKFMRKLKK